MQEATGRVTELLIAHYPDSDSRLAYLMRIPLGDGIVLRTSGTWPRTKALYCYPVPAAEWPVVPDIVERVPLRSCVRRGAAIDIIADRSRENRSQLVFTTARGREAVFWQSPRTRKQARPSITLPTAKAAGVGDLEIVVDAHERYAYHFSGKQTRTTKRALPCGDYGIVIDGTLVASVERKSLPDLISSLSNGKLRYALGELAARRSWSRSATRRSTSRTGCARRSSPTGWPNTRSVGRVSQSSSARTAASRRNGPTGIWLPRTRGLLLRPPPSSESGCRPTTITEARRARRIRRRRRGGDGDDRGHAGDRRLRIRPHGAETESLNSRVGRGFRSSPACCGSW